MAISELNSAPWYKDSPVCRSAQRKKGFGLCVDSNKYHRLEPQRLTLADLLQNRTNQLTLRIYDRKENHTEIGQKTLLRLWADCKHRVGEENANGVESGRSTDQVKSEARTVSAPSFVAARERPQ